MSMTKSNLEEKILDAATELFADHGFVKASVRDIAKQVGGSNSCLYVYFKNKDEILFRIISDVGADLLQALNAVISKEMEPVECLRQMIFTQVVFSMNTAKKMKIYLDELYQLPPALKKKALKQHRQIYDLYYRLINDLEQKKLLCTEVDKVVMAFGIFSSMNWVYRWLNPGGRLSAEDVSHHIATMFFRAILKEPPSAAQ
jgi:TetR/AcrR family transcriptional regulator, cholesterol catabolism regulator